MDLVLKNLPASAGIIRALVRSLGQEDPLQEGMATHSSILAWRVPWTESRGQSPCGLQCPGPQRVRRDLAWCNGMCGYEKLS